MKTRLFRRLTAKGSHSRWLGYATAGAATALAGSNCLEAGIHYSGRLDVTFAPQSNKRKEFRLDQPGDHFELTHLNFGVVEFEIIGFSHGFRGFVQGGVGNYLVSKLCAKAISALGVGNVDSSIGDRTGLCYAHGSSLP